MTVPRRCDDASCSCQQMPTLDDPEITPELLVLAYAIKMLDTALAILAVRIARLEQLKRDDRDDGHSSISQLARYSRDDLH